MWARESTGGGLGLGWRAARRARRAAVAPSSPGSHSDPKPVASWRVRARAGPARRGQLLASRPARDLDRLRRPGTVARVLGHELGGLFLAHSSGACDRLVVREPDIPAELGEEVGLETCRSGGAQVKNWGQDRGRARQSGRGQGAEKIAHGPARWLARGGDRAPSADG